MIGAKDVYNVISSTFPLYVPVFLGYGSVKWWKSFSPEQCKGINKLVTFFILPIFAFDCVSRINPFHLSPSFLAADVVSKAIIVVILGLWANCSHCGSYGRCITGFSLCTQANTLVVGVPLLSAMYGKVGQDLIVQAYLLQALVWFVGLLFVLEVRKVTNSLAAVSEPNNTDAHAVPIEESNSPNGEIVMTEERSMRKIMKVVLLTMATNPNSYASIAGMVWTLLSNRWHFSMPSLMEGSVTILSKSCGGMAMFSMGEPIFSMISFCIFIGFAQAAIGSVFMALQQKLIACGSKLAALGMVLRFIAGPAAMAIASIAFGLRGTVLRAAIVQAALPEAIIPFIYAKEYELHPEVLSTAVIFGTLVFLPVLITYYVLLSILH